MQGLPPFLRRARSVPASEAVTVVSGLPRSGTSMMMRMLEAGGLHVLIDSLRTADTDNPRGYFEFERVKALPEGDVEWLTGAHGKAVKIISDLIRWLPSGHTYRVLFMRRDLPEILASQRAMLARGGEGESEEQGQTDLRMFQLYTRHLVEVETLMHGRTDLEYLFVPYSALLADVSRELLRIRDFLARPLEVQAMALVVDQTLYRQRSEGERPS